VRPQEAHLGMSAIGTFQFQSTFQAIGFGDLHDHFIFETNDPPAPSPNGMASARIKRERGTKLEHGILIAFFLGMGETTR
jgi:hypothetical protein